MDILDHSDDEEEQGRYATSSGRRRPGSRFGARRLKRRPGGSHQHSLLMDCVGGSGSGGDGDGASEETVPLPDYERLSQSAPLPEEPPGDDANNPPPAPVAPAKQAAASPPQPPPPPVDLTELVKAQIRASVVPIPTSVSFLLQSWSFLLLWFMPLFLSECFVVTADCRRVRAPRCAPLPNAGLPGAGDGFLGDG